MSRTQDQNLPTQPGFFWARDPGNQWWNAIAHVYGETPYLRIDLYYYTSNTLEVDVNVYDIGEVGPMIATESPKIEERRKDWS